MSSQNEKIREQLSAYLDGELTPEQSRRVERLVRQDPDLSAEMESLRAVRRMVRQLPPQPAPDGLAESVVARARRRRTGLWWTSRMAAAAVLVTAVGITAVFYVNRPSRHGAVVPRQQPAGSAGAAGEATAPTKGENLRDWQNSFDGSMSMAREVLALPKAASRASTDFPAANIVINTDNLVLAQRDVERVFAGNRIVPLAPVAAERSGGLRQHGRENFYRQRRTAPDRVRYEAIVEEGQMRRIVSELNAIRAKQAVARIASTYEGDARKGVADGSAARARADDYEFGLKAKKRPGFVSGTADGSGTLAEDREDKELERQPAGSDKGAFSGSALVESSGRLLEVESRKRSQAGQRVQEASKTALLKDDVRYVRERGWKEAADAESIRLKSTGPAASASALVESRGPQMTRAAAAPTATQPGSTTRPAASAIRRSSGRLVVRDKKSAGRQPAASQATTSPRANVWRLVVIIRSLSR